MPLSICYYFFQNPLTPKGAPIFFFGAFCYFRCIFGANNITQLKLFSVFNPTYSLKKHENNEFRRWEKLLRLKARTFTRRFAPLALSQNLHLAAFTRSRPLRVRLPSNIKHKKKTLRSFLCLMVKAVGVENHVNLCK